MIKTASGGCHNWSKFYRELDIQRGEYTLNPFVSLSLFIFAFQHIEMQLKLFSMESRITPLSLSVLPSLHRHLSSGCYRKTKTGGKRWVRAQQPSIRALQRAWNRHPSVRRRSKEKGKASEHPFMSVGWQVPPSVTSFVHGADGSVRNPLCLLTSTTWWQKQERGHSDRGSDMRKHL